MSRLVLPLLSLLTFTSAQDTGYYVNKIPLKTRVSASRDFTYFVDNSFQPLQNTQFPTEGASIGSLYEDDYSADTVTCQNVECPKLVRLYSQVKVDSGKVTYTRVITNAIKRSLGVDASPIGLVAPFPGYCTSDDSLPIIELYSESKNQYYYWSPANPTQYFFTNLTTPDTSRFVPIRLVGYALAPAPARLVLENSTPDFQKVIAKGNYTHSFYITQEMVELVKDGAYGLAAKPSDVDNLLAATGGGYKYSKSLDFFTLSPSAAGNSAAMDAVCGARVRLYSYVNKTDSTSMRLYAQSENAQAVQDGYKVGSQVGEVLQTKQAVCGGIQGLSTLVEFKHKSQPGRYTYAVSPAKKTELANSGEWVMGDRTFGYLPVDTFGFMLINKAIAYPFEFTRQ